MIINFLKDTVKSLQVARLLLVFCLKVFCIIWTEINNNKLQTRIMLYSHTLHSKKTDNMKLGMIVLLKIPLKYTNLQIWNKNNNAPKPYKISLTTFCSFTITSCHRCSTSLQVSPLDGMPPGCNASPSQGNPPSPPKR